MAQQARLKCLNCGNEYAVKSEAARLEERTCPRCGSNSVRLLREE